MAHRVQRRAVRRARRTAHRGLRALRAAALGLTLAAAPAGAQAPSAGRAELQGSGRTSAAEWWGAGGRAGWLPEGDLGIGPPWTLAGLALGAWTLEEPGRLGAAFARPGVTGAQDPLAWSDTLGVSAGEGGAWEGYDASLARVGGGRELVRQPGDTRHPLTDVTLTQGDHGLSDHAIGLSRADTLGGLRIGAASGERRALGGVAGAGRDLYTVAGATSRGAHRLEGAFTHRRANAQLAGGESQEVRGEAGSVAWRYRARAWRLGAELLRGYDRHDSRGGPWLEQRRLADATAAALAFERRGARGRLGLRASWRESGVRADASAGARARARALWGAARWQRPLGDGDLDLSLGVGHHDALDRVTIAPALAWRFRAAPWDARVTVERLATPVWTDLAASQLPFLQDTWVGGLEVGAAVAGGGRARLGFLAGHTAHRAIVSRVPLESIALRQGYRGDPRAYDFGLLTGEAFWRTAHFGASLEGFALARDASALQPRVDPGAGARAALEVGFHYFQGDLGIRPRVEAWVVGPRESEASPSRRLPADGALGASLALSLADATLLLEGRDLTDRRIAQSWLDGATGREALSPGRELRMTFQWRLWD